MSPGAGELTDEWWGEEDFEPVEPCGCQGWAPTSTADQPTQKPELTPVAGLPDDDDRCFSCGTVMRGNDHYCPVRGGYV